ncbi:MAG: hypothetical protein ACT4P5_02250 [Armatimonadota bacterium]
MDTEMLTKKRTELEAKLQEAIRLRNLAQQMLGDAMVQIAQAEGALSFCDSLLKGGEKNDA